MQLKKNLYHHHRDRDHQLVRAHRSAGEDLQICEDLLWVHPIKQAVDHPLRHQEKDATDICSFNKLKFRAFIMNFNKKY